jgi:hypothetical protein
MKTSPQDLLWSTEAIPDLGLSRALACAQRHCIGDGGDADADGNYCN